MRRSDKNAALLGKTCAELTTRQGVAACKANLCGALREQRVPEIRGLAKLLGVPNYGCLRKGDLCAAIDKQIVTYFTLRDFVDGSKRLREMVQQLSDKSGVNGTSLNKLDAKKARQMASSLLIFVTLLLEKYTEMFNVAMTSQALSHEDRNKKLSQTATETMVYLRSALLGIGGSFVDPSMFRQ